MPGKLYLVATPIGNLSDISKRCAEVLGAADFIAAEDTRVTLRLLNHLGLKKPLVSYYEHNQQHSGRQILSRLLGGESCALVTDAGTPVISDPGAGIVSECAAAGVEILAIPGPCAAIAGLILSGLPAGRFCFEGFLSMNKKSRREHLASLRGETRTMIFYEAPHKLLSTLKDLQESLGDRRVSISRELTKLHEQTLRLTLSQATEYFTAQPPRGEFVLVVEGAQPEPEQAPDGERALCLAREYMEQGLSAKDAARRAANETGAAKNSVYAALHEEAGEE